MLGRDHALSGAVAFAAIGPLLHVTGMHLAAGVALTAGAGVLPDLDEPGSTIARTFGFLTGAFAWVIHQVSGGHRKGTHSLVGVALVTAGSLAAGRWQMSARAADGHLRLPWHMVPAVLLLSLLFASGFRALRIGGHLGDAAGIAVAVGVTWQGWDVAQVTSWRVPLLAVCVAVGMLAHLAGDMCTHHGCPLMYPLSRHDFGLLPQRIRITTNKIAEHWIVTPLLLAALAWFAWRSAGPAAAAHIRVAGRLRDGAEHAGLGKAVTGVVYPGSPDGPKACRRGPRDVRRVVIEEQHSPGWNAQHACDLCEGGDIGFEQAQLEGQEPVVKQADERPRGDAVLPVQHIGVAEAARGDAHPGLGHQLHGPGQRSDWPASERLEERSWAKPELPVSNHSGGELSLRAAAALEAADPAARQPAPPQFLLALHAGEFQHGAHAR